MRNEPGAYAGAISNGWIDKVKTKWMHKIKSLLKTD